MFKKKDIFSKLWLKHTNRFAYKEYKWDLQNYNNLQFTQHLVGSGKLNNIEKIKAVAQSAGCLNVLHSGNAGDIIYALATIKRINELTSVPVNVYLRLNRPNNLPNYNSHPVGNVMLNDKMAALLIPLIATQPYIESCKIFTDEEIHIDMDYFRAGILPMQGNIARWVGYITGVNAELWKSWLSVEPDVKYANSIVIARSGRYQNTTIDYTYLNKFNNLVFIGIEPEYQDIKKHLPGIKWLSVENFLQMAQIIAGCKFFIGNQSFPFSIAEGLKAPRMLELSLEIINVVPEGPYAHDFLFQDHFESLVEQLANAKN
ncbi:hypothetical protein MUGA111182_16365 [Mucilaginibacter galii]|uniref:Uncharacterized protein n=1 Tax=Mucilaginibacter galii TaxID=2005073 RepID=A0A917N2V4_9SPHI|nr:hypothetical protein [Mucilaginibacter galii]GGI52340.1 hypothetical protein GCM10011425_35520 [Mucilaginibacter galii]